MDKPLQPKNSTQPAPGEIARKSGTVIQGNSSSETLVGKRSRAGIEALETTFLQACAASPMTPERKARICGKLLVKPTASEQ